VDYQVIPRGSASISLATTWRNRLAAIAVNADQHSARVSSQPLARGNNGHIAAFLSSNDGADLMEPIHLRPQ
jgi:hypothetical protein